MQRSLVTGGAGFIGSHLVERLLSEGHHVRVLDDLSNGLTENLASVRDDVELIVGKVESEQDAERAVSGVDSVFHLAALGSVPRSIAHPMDTHVANADGTLTMLMAANSADVSKFVLASSSSVYGDHPTLPKSEPNVGKVLSPYALSKKIGEEYCRLYSDLHDLQTLSLRFFNVFGPRQRSDHPYAAVVPKFVDAAICGEAVQIHGDGLQSRDFTYVDNNVDGILAGWDSLTAQTSGRVCNLACEGQITLLEVIGMLEDVLGHSILVEHVPARAGDIRHSFADTAALRELSNFQPRVGVREGLVATIEWFRSLDLAKSRCR